MAEPVLRAPLVIMRARNTENYGFTRLPWFRKRGIVQV